MTATQSTLSDPLPASVTYVPGSGWASAGVLTDAAGIAWIGDVMSGQGVTIAFQVTVEEGVPVQNQAVVTDVFGTRSTLSALVNALRVYLPLIVRSP